MFACATVVRPSVTTIALANLIHFIKESPSLGILVVGRPDYIFASANILSGGLFSQRRFFGFDRGTRVSIETNPNGSRLLDETSSPKRFATPRISPRVPKNFQSLLSVFPDEITCCPSLTIYGHDEGLTPTIGAFQTPP